ncbi:carboxypeptidase M32 [Vibrio salinus]|uniref:carboxypeptidase M32 n=1 Tax=Vibrio salinus TaxID=2899784 RepID=UPI001E4D08CA|nr:carboxypeptidase M32 [Vibrio salinus]MCE0492486.1 carboxypeptidase M32 [Vibrio salinus]
MKAYEKLIAHFKRISRFEHLSAICGWDQAAMMPSGGSDARAEAMAELHVHIHKLLTQPQIFDWLEEASDLDLSVDQQAELREIRRQWELSNILPESLVEAKSLAGAKCEHAWRTQRSENDWSGFAKNWKEVVALSQEEAQVRSEITGLSKYDAMMQLYEPGQSSMVLDTMFDDIKSWLPSLISDVMDKQASENMIAPKGQYSPQTQKKLGVDVMQLLGFDFNHGRLDESIHPFCGGVPSDVRITTRYNPDEFVQSLMGIVHETGHARYEQGLPKAFSGTPAGQARSMGIHESQSLFFEMQIGRNPLFLSHLSRMAQRHFSAENDPVFQAGNFTKIYTRVNRGLIRVDADEVTYPAHIILRYEIERDLINGDIHYQDVPELWDLKMTEYLGLSTKNNFRDGCMQDIHWTDGSFGYFPSYTLGAIYAAQFMAAMCKTVNVNNVIQNGNLSPIFNWLSDNIWSKGSLLKTNELISSATGENINITYFKRHLQNRYL